MKKWIYFFSAFLTAYSFPLHSQEIQVVGVGTGQSASGNEINNYIQIGGSKPTDYKKIDDPAYECIYEYIISKNDKNGEPIKENYTTILMMGNNAGRFVDYTVYKTDSLAFVPDSERIWEATAIQAKKAEFKFTGDVILNYPEGKLTYTDLVTPIYQEYSESFPPMEWQIEEDQDTICGYLCTKAIGSYGGRDWEVWYAEEIPSYFGPWKFSGLPGLIMAAKDSEGVNEFRAISFREGKTPIAKPNNPLIQKTTREKFIGAKAKFETDPLSSINPESIHEIHVMKNRLIINGVEIPRRPNGYTPIELK